MPLISVLFSNQKPLKPDLHGGWLLSRFRQEHVKAKGINQFTEEMLRESHGCILDLPCRQSRPLQFYEETKKK